VVTPEGASIAGAQVGATWYSTRDGAPLAASPEPQARVLESSPDGTFRIEGLPGGSYGVSARARGHVSVEVAPVVVEDRKETDEVRLVLEPGLSVSGSVEDDAGVPVVGALVAATFATPKRSASGWVGWPEPVRADEGGRFVVGDLPPVSVVLTATAEGHDEVRRKDIEAGTEGVKIVLPRVGKIVGRVVDGAGGPVPKFWITVRQDLRSYETAEPKSFPFDDPEGRFVLEKRRVGIHDLFVEAEDAAPAVVEDVEVAPGEPAKEITVRLQRGGRIVGRVRLEDGTPVADAKVAASGDLPPLPEGLDWFDLPSAFFAHPPKFRGSVVRTQENGSFSLARLRPGAHELLVFAPGRGSISVPGVEVQSGGTTGPLDVVLPLGGAIAGRVTDAKGEGVDGAYLLAIPNEASSRDARPRWRHATSEGGEYRIGDLAPGMYFMVRATDEELGGSRPPQMQTAEVRSGETTRVDFGEGPKGATLWGLVEDAHGKKVSGAQVVLFHFGKVGSQMKSAFTDREGIYRIPELPPGIYGVYFTRGASFTSVFLGTVNVPDSPVEIRNDVDVPGGSIRGRVTAAGTGKPLSGAKVTLLTTLGPSPEFPGGFTMADEKGTYRFDDLGPRTYRISASASGFGQESTERISLAADGEKAGVDLALDPGGSLLLVALDASGARLPGALVTFRDARGGTAALGIQAPWLDANSSISADGVKPGRYTAVVLKDGAVAATGPFDVRAGERTEATIRGVPEPPR
jgi:hypothetical protein